MRKLAGHLRAHLRETPNAWAYGLSLALLLLLWALNFSFNFERAVLYPLRPDPLVHRLAYLSFFLVPWALQAVILVATTGHRPWQQAPGFWRSNAFALVLLALYVTFSWHRSLAAQWASGPAYPFAYKCLSNGLRPLLFALPLLVWWAWHDRRRSSVGFYGLRRTGFTAGPYLAVLALVLPLVAFASFQPSFIHYYPRYRAGADALLLGQSPIALQLAYELCYGLDFVFTELFFRGFLVLHFVRWWGPWAVLPMVGVYAFIHFDKPALEALASIFGGWALGVFALRTGSIWGGVLVHLGVAWAMDALALWQRPPGL